MRWPWKQIWQKWLYENINIVVQFGRIWPINFAKDVLKFRSFEFCSFRN